MGKEALKTREEMETIARKHEIAKAKKVRHGGVFFMNLVGFAPLGVHNIEHRTKCPHKL